MRKSEKWERSNGLLKVAPIFCYGHFTGIKTKQKQNKNTLYIMSQAKKKSKEKVNYLKCIRMY